MVPYATGGESDALGRRIAKQLAENLEQSCICQLGYTSRGSDLDFLRRVLGANRKRRTAAAWRYWSERRATCSLTRYCVDTGQLRGHRWRCRSAQRPRRCATPRRSYSGCLLFSFRQLKPASQVPSKWMSNPGSSIAVCVARRTWRGVAKGSHALQADPSTFGSTLRSLLRYGACWLV